MNKTASGRMDRMDVADEDANNHVTVSRPSIKTKVAGGTAVIKAHGHKAILYYRE